MGKVDRLRNKVEPWAALFWALCIVLILANPARRPNITPPPYRQHDILGYTWIPGYQDIPGYTWFNS